MQANVDMALTALVKSIRLRHTLRCALCGAEMHIIAFVTDAPALHSILTCFGRAHQPARSSPSTRAPRSGIWRPSPWPTGLTPRHRCPSSCSTSA